MSRLWDSFSESLLDDGDSAREPESLVPQRLRRAWEHELAGVGIPPRINAAEWAAQSQAREPAPAPVSAPVTAAMSAPAPTRSVESGSGRGVVASTTVSATPQPQRPPERPPLRPGGVLKGDGIVEGPEQDYAHPQGGPLATPLAQQQARGELPPVERKLTPMEEITRLVEEGKASKRDRTLFGALSGDGRAAGALGQFPEIAQMNEAVAARKAADQLTPAEANRLGSEQLATLLPPAMQAMRKRAWGLADSGKKAEYLVKQNALGGSLPEVFLRPGAKQSYEEAVLEGVARGEIIPVAAHQLLTQKRVDEDLMITAMRRQLEKDRGITAVAALEAMGKMQPDEVERLVRRTQTEDFADGSGWNNAFSRGVAKGWYGMGSGGLHFLRIFHDTPALREAALSFDEKASSVPQEITSLKEAKSIGDVGTYLAGATGEAAPMVAVSALTGPLTRGATAAGGVRATAQQVARQRLIGLGTGFATSFPFHAGNHFALMERHGKKARMEALGFGAVAAALDALDPTNLAPKLGGALTREAAHRVLSDRLRDLAISAAKEGFAEGFSGMSQDALQKVAEAYAADNLDSLLENPGEKLKDLGWSFLDNAATGIAAKPIEGLPRWAGEWQGSEADSRVRPGETLAEDLPREVSAEREPLESAGEPQEGLRRVPPERARAAEPEREAREEERREGESEPIAAEEAQAERGADDRERPRATAGEEDTPAAREETEAAESAPVDVAELEARWKELEEMAANDPKRPLVELQVKDLERALAEEQRVKSRAVEEPESLKRTSAETPGESAAAPVTAEPARAADEGRGESAWLREPGVAEPREDAQSAQQGERAEIVRDEDAGAARRDAEVAREWEAAPERTKHDALLKTAARLRREGNEERAQELETRAAAEQAAFAERLGPEPAGEALPRPQQAQTPVLSPRQEAEWENGRAPERGVHDALRHLAEKSRRAGDTESAERLEAKAAQAYEGFAQRVAGDARGVAEDARGVAEDARGIGEDARGAAPRRDVEGTGAALRADGVPRDGEASSREVEEAGPLELRAGSPRQGTPPPWAKVPTRKNLTPAQRQVLREVEDAITASASELKALGHTTDVTFARMGRDGDSGLAMRDGRMVLDPVTLEWATANLDPKKRRRFIERAVGEEVIHVAFDRFVGDSPENQQRALRVLNDEKAAVALARKSYPGFDKLTPLQQSGEVVRILMQARTGVTTEATWKFMRGFVGWLKSVFSDTKMPTRRVLVEIEQRMGKPPSWTYKTYTHRNLRGSDHAGKTVTRQTLIDAGKGGQEKVRALRKFERDFRGGEPVKVRYDKQGEIDLRAHAVDRLSIGTFSRKEDGASQADIDAAWKKMMSLERWPALNARMIGKYGGGWRKIFTWHHTARDGAMELVPSVINDAFPHTLGAAYARHDLFVN